MGLEAATRLVILGKANLGWMWLRGSTVCIQVSKCPRREQAGKGICGLLLSHKSQMEQSSAIMGTIMARAAVQVGFILKLIL